MEIVHELNQLDFGGVEKVIRNIIKFDKKNKHSIIAYKDGKYRKNLEDVGANIILLNDEKDDVDMAADVIHIHCGGAVSPLAHDLGKRFPIIETIHSPVRSPNPNDIISQRVGVSEAVARMNNEAICIHNGIDFDDLEPKFSKEYICEKMGIPTNRPVIGRLGRLGKDKGLEEWILTCYELQRQGYEFTPLIIGGEARDADGYRGVLKLMCESLPLKGVIWLANTNDIADYLQVMDIFLYPSPTEGFGLVFIEAMYMGAVVVSYDNDVNREIIGGYSVLVNQKHGIPGLVNGVKKCLDVVVADEILGLQTEFVTAEYDAESMSLAYQDLYENVLAKDAAKVR